MTTAETNSPVCNIKSYVDYLTRFVILIFLIEIFLCVYIFTSQTNCGKECSAEIRSEALQNEIKQILNDPKFCFMNGCYTTDRSDLRFGSEYKRENTEDIVSIIFLFVKRIKIAIEKRIKYFNNA